MPCQSTSTLWTVLPGWAEQNFATTYSLGDSESPAFLRIARQVMPPEIISGIPLASQPPFNQTQTLHCQCVHSLILSKGICCGKRQKAKGEGQGKIKEHQQDGIFRRKHQGPGTKMVRSYTMRPWESHSPFGCLSFLIHKTMGSFSLFYAMMGLKE